ncbi:type I-E CRISPR-associated protein Cas6/Cse3/CasE [Nonomuraea sp. NPDC052116]|uniref:type I-E CRISPR-associated protein Cas6/Cse3/CasE n=1 Tax=Nonomuraea sp. NPDC052116 TaxID=3155665 RepID=UPI00342A4424
MKVRRVDGGVCCAHSARSPPRTSNSAGSCRASRMGIRRPARAHRPAHFRPGPFDDAQSSPREVRITARACRSFDRKAGGKPVVLHTATFGGRLRMIDAAAFTERLLGSIGPAKSYGWGLLTLAPLPGSREGR